ncbi:EH signature domain-containing protein [Desulfobacter latus]|uniref:Zorya protein ZorC EH domain-containing protein n=1 Tax=Desulfobacter latus TaxID=2292 RepID=A0A850TBC9_9BACT|nr:EH signature domain-containing protein [Desulfobacter latus]NWH06735.1 hypothetical protein [Desulfobacter latus]
MTIKNLTFDLPPLNFEQFQHRMTHQQQRLEKIIKKSGKNSKAYKTTKNEIILRVKRKEKHLENFITDSLTIRALTDLWLEEAFNVRCPVTEQLMDAIFSTRKYPGTISFLQLIRLFFLRFDKCGDLDVLINGLHRSFKEARNKKLPNDIQAIADHYDRLISKQGPEWIVKLAVSKKIDLDTLQQKMGLSYYFNGRFGDVCKYHYYLEQLKALQPNETSPLFSELRKWKVYRAPYKKQKLLGHKIISILIDKAPESELCKEWRDVILNIAGDPRVPKTSLNYMEWWEPLGQQRVNKMQTWLSGFDLLLFLEILENYGKSSGNAVLQRMFPARKKFLEGLYKNKMIHGSRLFVSTSADNYLQSHYKKSELPGYAICKGGASVIYLNIKGHHMVEGSHSFSLWIYDKLPEESSLLDYSINSFEQRELGIGLKEKYEHENIDSLEYPINIRHMPHWQHKTIEAFSKLNIKINPESVFSIEDYQEYKQKYGLSY